MIQNQMHVVISWEHASSVHVGSKLWLNEFTDADLNLTRFFVCNVPVAPQHITVLIDTAGQLAQIRPNACA